MTEFISKEKIFANATKLAEILLESENYSDFHERLSTSDIDYIENKTYEVAPSGFIDFNHHLYEPYEFYKYRIILRKIFCNF